MEFQCPRVVLDTNCLISALLFSRGVLGQLRSLWQEKRFIPLLCTSTVKELIRVLAYPKFKLTPDDIQELLGDILPWAEIVELVRNQGQPLRGQHVVYFSIISGGVKPGETKDIIQRYSTINRATPVQKMWYMEVANKAQAQAAEHALHNIFDHARCMNRCQNKKDYYECNEEQAQKFITANAHKIHQAIMEAIEGIE